MRSSRSKVLHELFGRPMLEYGLEALRSSGIRRTMVVAGANYKALRDCTQGRFEVVLQKRRLGTGHAVLMTRPKLRSYQGHLVVIAGDVPLILGPTLREFCRRHVAQGAEASVLTAHLPDPEGYGRILRDAGGEVAGIREELDASRGEKEIREVNSSIYCFRARPLFAALKKVRPENRKREYYLTDVIGSLVRNGLKVCAFPLAQGEELLGINTRKDLAEASKVLRKRNVEFHMNRGVTIVSPETTYIESGVKMGRDTVVYPFTYIEKGVTVGKRCRLGPFCKIRSGSRIRDEAVIGSFVEIVRSEVGSRTMVKHLTYLGDARVGRGVNIGAGAITANFDGRAKNKTRIGDRAFIGCDTILVAPVSIGKGATTGAGSVILRGRKIPANATAVGIPARVVSRKKRTP